MRLRCVFGFHAWGNWEEAEPRKSVHDFRGPFAQSVITDTFRCQKRQCALCNKLSIKQVEKEKAK